LQNFAVIDSLVVVVVGAVAMSKRQRFFVESIQDQITVISWKKLVADAERIATSETAAPSNIFHANSKTVPGSHLGLHQATVPENSNTTESNPLVSIETAGTLNKVDFIVHAQILFISDLCSSLCNCFASIFSTCSS